MKLKEYKALPFKLQRDVTWRGVRVADRPDKQYIIALFQYHAFYCEVYYLKSTLEMQKIYSFDNLDLLEPYLNKISIEFL